MSDILAVIIASGICLFGINLIFRIDFYTNKDTLFYFLPTVIYKNTKMNIFGCILLSIFCFITNYFWCILAIIILIIDMIINFIYNITHVGRQQ